MFPVRGYHVRHFKTNRDAWVVQVSDWSGATHMKLCYYDDISTFIVVHWRRCSAYILQPSSIEETAGGRSLCLYNMLLGHLVKDFLPAESAFEVVPLPLEEGNWTIY